MGANLLRALLCLAVTLPLQHSAKQSEAIRVGVDVIRRHRTLVDVPYHTAGGRELKLDVYASTASQPAATLIYFHGGGWLGGNKELSMPLVMPYLDRKSVV